MPYDVEYDFEMCETMQESFFMNSICQLAHAVALNLSIYTIQLMLLTTAV